MRVCVGAGERRFDRVVSTLPDAPDYGLTAGLPDEYRERYDWGDGAGRALRHPGAGSPLRAMSTGSTSTIPATRSWRWSSTPTTCRRGLRRPSPGLPGQLPADGPPAVQARASTRSLAEFLPHLRRINPDFRDEWVTGAHAFAAPYAQPIVTTDYPRHIPPHADAAPQPVPGQHVPGLSAGPRPELQHRHGRAPGASPDDIGRRVLSIVPVLTVGRRWGWRRH